LWQILAVLTTRKAVSARRREAAAKRGTGQVIATSNLDPGSDSHIVELFGDLAGVEPTPVEAAAAVEEFNRLLELLNDDDLRTVARSRLEGFTNEEIADRSGFSLATVERKLKRIRTKWQDELHSESI
jgi:DNA-directed RNA polymerase specialized sigma24 family protein